MAFEVFFKPILVLPVVLLFCYFAYAHLTSKSNLPDLPWVGVGEGQWFAKISARLRTTFQYKKAIEYAYENVSCTLLWVC